MQTNIQRIHMAKWDGGVGQNMVWFGRWWQSEMVAKGIITFTGKEELAQINIVILHV